MRPLSNLIMATVHHIIILTKYRTEPIYLEHLENFCICKFILMDAFSLIIYFCLCLFLKELSPLDIVYERSHFMLKLVQL